MTITSVHANPRRLSCPLIPADIVPIERTNIATLMRRRYILPSLIMGAKKIEIETATFAAKIDRFLKSRNRPNTKYYSNFMHIFIHICSVSQTPLKTCGNFSKMVRNFSQNFTRLLCIPIYARLQIFIQLSATLTKLCHIKCDHPVDIMCAKCPSLHFSTPIRRYDIYISIS